MSIFRWKMFKKLKDKIADEVKQNPRLQVMPGLCWRALFIWSYCCREPWSLSTSWQLPPTQLSIKKVALESPWPPPSPVSTPSLWERTRGLWRTGPVTLTSSVLALRLRPHPVVASSSHWGRMMNQSVWVTPRVPQRLPHLSITQVNMTESPQ